MTYTVRVREESIVSYRVTADSADEAQEFVLNGSVNQVERSDAESVEVVDVRDENGDVAN
jgi:hypothetical protein